MDKCMKSTENRTWHTVSPIWISFVVNFEAFYISFPTDGVRTHPCSWGPRSSCRHGLQTWSPSSLLSKLVFPRHADPPHYLLLSCPRGGILFSIPAQAPRVCLSFSIMISLFPTDTWYLLAPCSSFKDLYCSTPFYPRPTTFLTLKDSVHYPFSLCRAATPK